MMWAKSTRARLGRKWQWLNLASSDLFRAKLLIFALRSKSFRGGQTIQGGLSALSPKVDLSIYL